MSNMLHIVSINSGHKALFERMTKGDALLFIASSVLCLHKNSHSAKTISAYCQDFKCYALEADLLARGLASDETLPEITTVDYQGFVSLTVEHEVIKTWN